MSSNWCPVNWPAKRASTEKERAEEKGATCCVAGGVWKLPIDEPLMIDVVGVIGRGWAPAAIDEVVTLEVDRETGVMKSSLLIGTKNRGPAGTGEWPNDEVEASEDGIHISSVDVATAGPELWFVREGVSCSVPGSTKGTISTAINRKGWALTLENVVRRHERLR